MSFYILLTSESTNWVEISAQKSHGRNICVHSIDFHLLHAFNLKSCSQKMVGCHLSSEELSLVEGIHFQLKAESHSKSNKIQKGMLPKRLRQHGPLANHIIKTTYIPGIGGRSELVPLERV